MLVLMQDMEKSYLLFDFNGITALFTSFKNQDYCITHIRRRHALIQGWR